MHFPLENGEFVEELEGGTSVLFDKLGCCVYVVCTVENPSHLKQLSDYQTLIMWSFSTSLIQNIDRIPLMSDKRGATVFPLPSFYVQCDEMTWALTYCQPLKFRVFAMIL